MSKAFTLDDIAFLTSDKAEKLLQKLTTEDLSDRNLINLIPKLRGTYSAEQTSAAIETVKLRRKALDKFGDDAAKMLFTQDALEQASDPLIRKYRSDKIAHMDENTYPITSDEQILDAGCGIGSDAIALSRNGLTVIGYDLDATRITMAQYNAVRLNVAARFEMLDITQHRLDARVIFFDPARRDEKGNRIYNPEKYMPPLSTIHQWDELVQIVIKVAPGIDYLTLPEIGYS
ncbi:MAG: class I SAM-dependent methyltransferase, partial [Chloroflexota bacterium]